MCGGGQAEQLLKQTVPRPCESEEGTAKTLSVKPLEAVTVQGSPPAKFSWSLQPFTVNLYLNSKSPEYYEITVTSHTPSPSASDMASHRTAFQPLNVPIGCLPCRVQT